MISNQEMRYHKKYGAIAGAHIFRLKMLNMRNGLKLARLRDKLKGKAT